MFEDCNGIVHVASNSDDDKGDSDDPEEEEEPAWKKRYSVKFAPNLAFGEKETPSAAHPNLLGKSLPIRIPVSQSWVMPRDTSTGNAPMMLT